MIQIDACKNGDKEALGELYTTYANRLLGVCRHYVKDDNSAHDILHDAFIIIFMSIQDLKDESKLEGWMITIVRNLSLKYIQNTEKRSHTPLSCLNIEIQEAACEEQKKIEFGLLLSAIESLPEGNREVFKLSVLEGLSHKEIGEQLGINPHSSSSQLFRAKKTLRAMLINYWMLFLLPILIPVYIYIATRDKTVETSDNEPTATNTHKSQSKYVQKGLGTLKKEESRYSTSPNINGNNRRSSAGTIISKENIISQVLTDSTEIKQRALLFNVDSLQKHLAIGIGTNDSLYCIPQTPQDKMIALNERKNFNVCNKKKYPWTFNMGYSSNAGANGAMSNLNYLSVVDYANGGAAAKLYTWDDYVNYLVRNNALMDSVERAKMSWIALNNATEGNASLGEKAHHYRPQTFSLSLNKQLSSHWTFGTGLTYTRIKSDFESEFHGATLLKTQKIDYVGIPLRLTYIITSDSSYTLKGDIKPRYQWSVNLGIGVQYRLFKPFSLYLEPNMFYYFGNGSGLETYRTEHPFIITVPFGLRLTW